MKNNKVDSNLSVLTQLQNNLRYELSGTSFAFPRASFIMADSPTVFIKTFLHIKLAAFRHLHAAKGLKTVT